MIFDMAYCHGRSITFVKLFLNRTIDQNEVRENAKKKLKINEEDSMLITSH